MIFQSYLWFFLKIIQFEVNYSTIFVLGTRVNMTKKCMDDRLCVFSCDTQKQQKLHSLFLATFCLLQNTYLFVK